MSTPNPDDASAQFSDEELAYIGSLFDAARDGRTEDLRVALDAGVPANLTNGKGDTLLILAAYHEREDTVAMLLDHGADTERVSDKGFTALACSVFRGNETITRGLLEAGAGQATSNQHVQDFATMFGQGHLLPLLQQYEPGQS